MNIVARIVGLLMASLLLSACGTAQTVAVDHDESISITANGDSTRCDAIPRIYSGVAYNLCWLNSPHSAVAGSNERVRSQLWSGVLIDTAFSAAFDTLLLPWTVYTQSTRGNIPIEK